MARYLYSLAGTVILGLWLINLPRWVAPSLFKLNIPDTLFMTALLCLGVACLARGGQGK